MNKLCGALGIGATMVGLAVASANEVITDTGFELGLYGLLGASIAMMGRGNCRWPFAR